MFPFSAIPGMFKRSSEKKNKPQPKEFDLSDLDEAMGKWKTADPAAKDLIVLGLEVAIRDIATAKFKDEKKKLEALVAARDLLWSLR